MKQWQLFLAFFRVGMLGFGGGPSSIPLFHKEVVEKYKWMSDDEFSDTLALANALPGPIATKMAGYIGHRVGGVLGMLVSIIATSVPTVLLLILMLTALNSYKDRPWVHGMSQAVVPVVAVMLGVLTWDFVKKSKKSLGWKITIGLLAVSLLLLSGLGVHPGIVIAVLLGLALMSKKSVNEKQVKAS
ncbi:chromate transporter [Rossellomorea marisflavi]|uniref:chromate transporter n=1 Tax=Rossellomorea marisflavi TaxID=189381 RepID=UPI0028535EC7|nr:chromate transporter [Rossellomorea marisflavi]MDR4935460.1 chromate transporter [Rossellomorea marisflavi]